MMRNRRERKPKGDLVNRRVLRNFGLAYAILNILNVISLGLYLGFEPEGLLPDIAGALWALSFPFGAALLAFDRGRMRTAAIWSGLLIFYLTSRTVTGYHSHFHEWAGDYFYIVTQGLPLFLFLLFAVWTGFRVFRARRAGGTVRPVLALAAGGGAILLSVWLTWTGFSSVGILHTSRWLEHHPSLFLTGNLVLLLTMWIIRLIRAGAAETAPGQADALDRSAAGAAGRGPQAASVCIVLLCCILTVNALGGGWQLFSAFAASRANEVESKGITLSSRLQQNPFTGTGSRGLFKENRRIVSYYYYSPLSIPMNLAGYMQETDWMKVRKNAGNWHENTHDGIRLRYDVYSPTWTEEETPVIINLHGHHSRKQYWDSYEQFVDLGFTVIDVEYGSDSHSKKLKVGTHKPIPGYSYRGPNYDLWVKDMEHLFRYLKEHEEDLNIDLNRTFLYGHSYGSYMAVGMDNLLKGLGYIDYNGKRRTARYDQFAKYYHGAAAAKDVASFVRIRGMILMYGIDGRFFNSDLDPILFCYGRSDDIMKLQYTEQMFKMRDTYNIPHAYIMDAGAASHGFDYLSGNAFCNQLTLRYAGMFLERWG